MISAEIIADSKNEYGNRLTTFKLTMPRMILAEFNTHRMISKNSASSRAIPFERMLEMVEKTPFIPIKWMKDHKGMQGNEYFDKNEIFGFIDRLGCGDTTTMTEKWLDARDYAVDYAKMLSKAGLTKQMCNRLLEPFMYHTVIATATEWENFFALRANDAAEIHMQNLAYKMLDAYNESNPVLLKAGEWHAPLGGSLDYVKGLNTVGTMLHKTKVGEDELEKLAVKIATANCARVSYTTVGDGNKEPNYDNDVKLHDNLSNAGHMSPFEHCAMAPESWNFHEGKGERKQYWSGNFQGFTQYRKLFLNENRKDSRVLTK